ncbi:heterokaryon incompatibility protein-domain-containing protein [Corynascus novoguineensis]|uniref:Heterokaryon incompatibility protein-domain-containing protein n=1 Tax=Corynascus novoguineensis TaxID=1126955 RepID=A0AAN7CQZ9_9PEZI|nr:heterokaryon incompatibility protein-domain-containing protein [Corynascus novoguineensis]
MRLLKTTASAIPRVREFVGSQIPPYAILSHTWDQDEVTLQQLLTANLSELQTKAGFQKIQQTCALTRTRDGFEYAWVDTCCIDKTSSAELSEAINSMFAWYHDAKVCYVFLADLPPSTADDLWLYLPRCRWFKRGWTLQELLAPREVLFFDREWNYRGNVKELARLVGEITGIPRRLLRREAELSDFAVARRMSWAAARETTRVEDMAYCLLGIFDVNLSLIYGEGAKAYSRLQEAIIQSMADLSIFAWKDDRDSAPLFTGILADSPAHFAWCNSIDSTPGDSAYTNFTMTTRGIQTDASLILDYSKPGVSPYGCSPNVIFDTCCRVEGRLVGVRVRKVGGGLYARCQPDKVFMSAKYTDQLMRMPLDMLTFAIRLPARFPFHPGPDPVVGNRHSAIRINLPQSLADPSAYVMPRSHWDEEQEVFFCLQRLHKGLVRFLHPGLHVRFLVGCFGCNMGPSYIVLGSMEAMSTETSTLLRSQLDRLKLENHRQARELVLGTFDTTLREGPPLPADFGSLMYLTSSVGWSGLRSDLRIELRIRKERQPRVCVNPTMVIDIFCTLP